ncbi:uncharacterized protein LOC143264134 isoform X2 [Megachile rotundata]|uniref:uncharacterized protein LOC143264134 isoform X2 n=1 Tax=Megachile rotundata TaxID=143995 RepID=UPI003FCEE871
MCASNTPCRSPPRSGSPRKSNPDYVRFPQQQPPHHHPYVYYPPPYPPFNPYSPYPPYPGNFYSSYCNDVAQDSKGFSWFSIFLVIFLLLGVIGAFCYRTLSRDTRRRLHARLPTLMQPTQDYNRGDRVL